MILKKNKPAINPISVRLSLTEISTLKKVTHTKEISKAIHTLIGMELERQNQDILFKKIYGSMKPSDFNADYI